MANQISVLNWLQRGSRVYLNVARTLSGVDVFSIDQLADKHQLNLLDSERKNRIFIRDTVAVVSAEIPFDADTLLDAVQAFDAELASVTMDQGPLGSTSTTTSTTTTTTTTTTSTTTTTTTTTTT